jgi:hypothetical protein
MRAAILALLLQLPAGGAPPANDYRTVVEQFATDQNAAIERMLALPYDILERGVRDAARESSGWSAEALDRAVLMHGDAVIALSRTHSADAVRQLRLADELAGAAARVPGNEWFVHRWYRAFTASIDAKAVAENWRQQPWYRAAKAVDRARELETEGGRTPLPVDLKVYDPPAFRQAMPLLEQAIAARLPVASLHLGRIEMLRGNDTAARRHLDVAASDQMSRVTRYLANLFLGAIDEREFYPEGAEAHYRKAIAALPRAQSGRLALAALLARTGRAGDAGRAIAVADSSKPYDPWWTYFFIPREEPSILAELHAEVCQ